MATYKNDYSPEEDRCLWELHAIRAKMASQVITTKKIKRNAKLLLKKHSISFPVISLKKEKPSRQAAKTAKN